MATYNPSLDGHVARIIADHTQSWANIHNGAGNTSIDDSANMQASIDSDETGFDDKWDSIQRPILVFDLSELSSVQKFSAVTLTLIGTSKTQNNITGGTLNVFGSSPASNIALVDADYGTLGTIALATAIAYASFDGAGSNVFTFTATGIAAVEAAIAGDGILKIGLREATYDAPDITPTWAASINLTFQVATVEDADVPDRPLLTITYLPIVTTQAVSKKISTTATGNGDITNLGDPTAIQHGHCWNTTGIPTISEPLVHTTIGGRTENGVPSATGAFTSSLTALVPTIIYYIRAYATNSDGTSYGEQVTFVAGTPRGSDLAGVIRVVEERFHWVTAFGKEVWVKGTPVV